MINKQDALGNKNLLIPNLPLTLYVPNYFFRNLFYKFCIFSTTLLDENDVITKNSAKQLLYY